MRLSLAVLAFGILAAYGCDYNHPSDYDAKKDFRKYQEEQKAAQEKAAAQPADPAKLAEEAAKKDYNTFCSSCHGADGKADSVTAKALNPKPRNFTDAAWQGSVDDAHIAKVIKEGGASVGLSPTMAPWGASLKDEQIQALVKVVRSFKQ